MRAETKPPEKPRRSGFCNLSWSLDIENHRASHRRCSGCCCICHTPGFWDLPLPGDTTLAAGEPSHPDLEALTLTQAVDLLYAAAEKLNEVGVYDTVRRHDLEESIRLIDRIRAAHRKAGDVEHTLVRNAYAKGRGDHVIDGIGPVKVIRSDDRKSWDERGAAQQILDAHLSGSDGTPPAPWDVVDWLLEAFHVDYMRLGALRALGIDPDTVSERIDGRPTVRLPGGR